MPATTSTGSSSTTASGFLIDWTPAGIKFARKYVGEEHIPQEIKRRRRQVYDAMRHMGSPVLVKHMYNASDVDAGLARRSDNFDAVYGQTRHGDPISHGIGYVSVETVENEWILLDGTIAKAETKPAGAKAAPKYRGFGPGYLIFMIQPDAAEDIYRLNPAGALIKVQTATAQAPWFPEINDNDLIINVEIDRVGNILNAYERFQAKMTNPVSIRGFGDKFGRSENAGGGSNRFIINQQFEMTLVPTSDELYQVEVDR